MINSNKLRKITAAAILSSLAVVMVTFLRTPLFASASFLEYDPADIPILVGGILLGPIWGLAITLIVAGIQALTVSAQSGIYGFIMHVIATGTLVVIYSLVFKYMKTRVLVKNITAILSSTIIATAGMVAGNLLITPYFMGIEVSAVKSMLLPIIIPFNLISHGGNAIITAVLYKYIGKYLETYKNK
jgi:riboflavin transporter FmnP